MSKSNKNQSPAIAKAATTKVKKVMKTFRNIASPAFNRNVTVCILRKELGSQRTQFSVGLAVRNPSDKEDEVLAKTIALGRAEKNPSMGYILSVEMRESGKQIPVLFDHITKEVENHLNLFFRGLGQVDPLTTTIKEITSEEPVH